MTTTRVRTMSYVSQSSQTISNLLREILASKKMYFGVISLTASIILALSATLYSPEFPRNFDFPRNLPPSTTNPLGTEVHGKDILGLLLYSISTSFQIGLLAGLLGVFIGVIVGVVAGYKGGFIDATLIGVIDIFLVIPLWPLLVVLSVFFGNITISLMSALIAIFTWAGVARMIRSQVMSLKEREYIKLARISGLGSIEIMVKEIIPNMLPWIGASLANAVSGAMMAEIGLGIIGIGPSGLYTTTLGLMISRAIQFGALGSQMWWWILPPIAVIIVVFLSLQSINMGLDERYNPKLRQVTGR